MAPRRRLQQKQGRGSNNEVDVPVSEASASGRAANKRVKSQQKSDVKKKTQPQQQGGEVTKSSKQRQCKVDKRTSDSVDKDQSKKSIKQKTLSRSTKKPIASEEDVNTVNNLENNAESETVELKAAMKPNKKSKTVRFDVEHSETDDETSVLNQQPVKATALQAKSKSNQAVKKNTKTKSTTTKRKASNSTTKVEQEAPETAKVETDTKEEPVKKNTGAKVARTTKKRAVTKANSIIEQEEVIANNEQESDGKVEEVKKSAKTRGRRTRKNTSATTNSVVKEGIKKNARNQEKVSESGDEIKQSRKNARVKAAKTEPTVPELITNNKGKRAKMQTDVSEVVEKTKQQSKSTKKTTAKGRVNAKKKTPEVDVRAMEVEESTAALASGADDKAGSVEESLKAELAITKKTTRPKRAVKPKESKADKVDPKGKVTKRQHQQQKSAKQARQTLAKALSVEKDNLMQQAQSKVEKKTTNKKTRQNLVQKDADERSDGNDSSEKTVEAETMKKGKRTTKRAKVIAANTDINGEDTSSVPRSKRLNLLGDCKSVDQQIEMQVTDSGEDKKEERQIEDSTINVTINDITPDDGRLQQLSKERELTPSELCSSKIDESCKEILSEEPLELHPIVPESSNYLAESAKISAEQGDGSLNSHFDVGQPSPKRPSVAESCDKESEESLDLHLDILESPKRGSDVLESCGKQRKESLDSHLDDSYESSHHDHMDVSQHTPSGAQPSNDTEMGGQNSHAEHEVPVDQEPTIVDETSPPSAIAAVDVSDTNRAKVSPNCSANSFANSDQLGSQTLVKSGAIVEEEWISDDEDDGEINVVDHSSNACWNLKTSEQKFTGSFLSETDGADSKVVTDDDEEMNETVPMLAAGHINEQMIRNDCNSKKLSMNVDGKCEKDQLAENASMIVENEAFERHEETVRRSSVVGVEGCGSGEQQTFSNKNAKDEYFESIGINSVEISQEFLERRENASNRKQKTSDEDEVFEDTTDNSMTFEEKTFENFKNQQPATVTDEKEMTDEGVHEGCEYNNEKILLPMDGGDAEVFEECCDVMTLPSNHSSLLVSRPSANVDNTGAVGDVLESVINKLEMPVTDVSTVNENQHISQNLDGIKGDAVDDLIAEQKHQLMDELQFDDENAIQQGDESAIQQDTKQMTKDNPDDFVRCENEQEIQKPATDLQTNKNSNSAKKRSAIPSSVRSRFELQHKKFWEKAPTIQEHVDRIKQLHSKHQSEIPNTFRRLAQSKASNSGSSGIPRRCTSESRSSVSALKTLAKSSIDRNTASQKAAAATSAVKSAAGGGALSTSAAGHQLSRLPCPQVNVKSLTRQRAKEERLMNRSVQRPSPLSRSEPRLSKRLERLATPKKLARPSTSARRQGEQDKIASTSGGMHRGLQSYVDTTAMNDKQYADAMKRGMIKPLNTSFSLRKSSTFQSDSIATTMVMKK